MDQTQRFGNYMILSLIGRGGMGEVYRARDSKLGREVAVKVLPASFTGDPDRVARFEQEARLLASLNHPNIATIHGLEESEGRNLLVMELVEGHTLADRLESGPMPLQEVFRLAGQIAEAVEAAHEKGVIHRDLKPANIKVTPDGRVKVLDFGLAKAFAGDGRGGDLSQSPTISLDATQKGVLLGTAGYMSPEQARGEAVDRRTDIWAFGCVLYEMLTGTPVFGRGTVAESLARVLEGRPDLDQLPAETPDPVRRLLRRCLEKNPKDRLQHIGDARIEIREAAEAAGSKNRVQPEQPPTPSRRRFVTVAGAAAAAALAASLVTSQLRPQPPAAVRRLSIGPFPMSLFTTAGDRHVTISPDGERVALVSSGQIWVRPLGEDVPFPIAPGGHPFFSPDGEWVAFFTDFAEGVMRAPANGGIATRMFRLESGTGGAGRAAGGAWRRDGTIVVATGSGLYRGSAEDTSGELEQLIAPPPGEVYAWPRFLPDGRVLFSIVSDTAETATIATIDLGTWDVRPVHSGGVGAYYLPDGYLVYATGSQGLAAVRFDAEAGRVVGTALEIPNVQVRVSGAYHAAAFAVSDTGTLVHVPPPPPAAVQPSQLVWVDEAGNEEIIGGAAGSYPRVSPDGRLALNASQANGALRRIWVFDLDLRSSIQVSGLSAPGASFEDLLPEWSVDGRRIYFASTRTGPMQVWSVAADGSGTERLLIEDPDASIWPHRAHPSGQLLVGRGPYGGAIGVVDLADPSAYEWILDRPSSEAHPDLSPDGRWIAYDSDESGDQYEVFVRPFPNVEDARIPVSGGGGGAQPRWDPRGRNRLYYRNLEGGMMAATFGLDPEFRVLRVDELFPNNSYSPVALSGMTYDISPVDGRFVLSQATPAATPYLTTIPVTLNWIEDLQALLGPP